MQQRSCNAHRDRNLSADFEGSLSTESACRPSKLDRPGAVNTCQPLEVRLEKASKVIAVRTQDKHRFQMLEVVEGVNLKRIEHLQLLAAACCRTLFKESIQIRPWPASSTKD